MQEEAVLNIVTVGHVDHGKSTVVGRMLADAGALPQGKLEAIRASCERNSKPFEYAFLLDALHNEQDQGITIDAARCFFRSQKRPYIIIDAPGHIEFLKNMVTGASRAQAALMVVDAGHGVEENTRRHGYFLSMLGVRQVVVLVNKMDLIGYRREVFETVRRELADFFAQIGITPEAYIPVSGLQGDNVVFPSERMPWYRGCTVLQQLDTFTPILPPAQQGLRMPVQGVYKFTQGGDERRIIAGTVDAGTIRAGDAIVFYPSGKKTRVNSLEVFSAPVPERFEAGQAAGFTMTDQIFVRRGEVACRQDETPPQVGVRLLANLFWLGKQPLETNKRYKFKCGTAEVEMHVEEIRRVINAATLVNLEARSQVLRNEVAECVLRLERPVCYDVAGGPEATGRFVIVDAYEIAGGGIITEALEAEDYDRRNLRWSAAALTRAERTALTGRRGLVVWMTGLSGAGKTTIAQEAERRLIAEGFTTYLLDGDKLRRGLNGDLGFSDADRAENVRRVSEVANLFADAGLVAIVTLISPFAEGRAAARRVCADGFMEVYVKASVETCMARDPKHLYRKAQSGSIAAFTGLTSPYEAPEAPELVLDTEALDERACVDALVEAVLLRLQARGESL